MNFIKFIQWLFLPFSNIRLDKNILQSKKKVNTFSSCQCAVYYSAIRFAIIFLYIHMDMFSYVQQQNSSKHFISITYCSYLSSTSRFVMSYFVTFPTSCLLMRSSFRECTSRMFAATTMAVCATWWHIVPSGMDSVGNWIAPIMLWFNVW